MTYDTDYPKSRIGRGNPYMQCSECGVSEPEINGNIYNHREWCSYRIRKLNRQLYSSRLLDVLEEFDVMNDDLFQALENLMGEEYYSGN
jgi:hypothetical protein